MNYDVLFGLSAGLFQASEQGDDSMMYDVFFSFSGDRLQASKNKHCDVWLFPALNFSLASYVRYKANNFLPIFCLPGPNQPQDMQPFLIPFVNEIWRAHHENVTMKFYDGVVRRVRIQLLYLRKISRLSANVERFLVRTASLHAESVRAMGSTTFITAFCQESSMASR